MSQQTGQLYVRWHAYLICPLRVGPRTRTRVDPDTIRCSNSWEGFRLEIDEDDTFKTKE